MWRGEKDISQTKTHLKFVIDTVSQLSEISEGDKNNFTVENIKVAIWPYAEKVGKGNVLWPMRYSLSGKEKSPDPFIIAGILGKTETVRRLTIAYNAL
jgi:glutamyl/glutaminyl-tRNA synthetase